MYKKSLNYLFKTDEPIKHYGIGLLLFISIIGWVAILGYVSKIITHRIKNKETPFENEKIPSFFPLIPIAKSGVIVLGLSILTLLIPAILYIGIPYLMFELNLLDSSIARIFIVTLSTLAIIITIFAVYIIPAIFSIPPQMEYQDKNQKELVTNILYFIQTDNYKNIFFKIFITSIAFSVLIPASALLSIIPIFGVLISTLFSGLITIMYLTMIGFMLSNLF